MIDAMLDPAGRFLIDNHGYAHSNSKSFDLVEKERMAALNLTRDPTGLLHSGLFLQPIKDRAKLI